MATIRETRAANAKRKAEEEKADREAEAEIQAIRDKRKKKPAKKKDERSFLDKIRDALSTEDSDADAIAAIESGIAEADAANRD
jgi:hypothetical protein